MPDRPPPRRQREGAPAIVDQPNKPAPGSVVPPRRIGRRLVTMADEPTPSQATENLMDPFPERPRAAEPGEITDQQPAPASAQPAAGSEGPGYLRLRFRVRDGQMSMRGASFVEGPLDRPQSVTAGLGYEARVGRRRVAAGDVPEFTERRSFPDPAGRPGMERHHISEVPFQDITVRIPADAISADDLEQLTVDLFRWTGRGPGEHIAISELRAEPATEVTRIARFTGMSAQDVDEPIRRRLQR